MNEPTIYKPSIYNAPTIYNNGGGGEIVPTGYKVCLFAYKFNSVNSGIRNYNESTICTLPRNGSIEVSFTIPAFSSGNVYPLNVIYTYFSIYIGMVYNDAKFIISSNGGTVSKDLDNSSEYSYNLILEKDGSIILNNFVGIIHRAADLQINTFFDGIGGSDWIGTKIYSVKIKDNQDKVIHHFKFGRDENYNMYIIDVVNGDVSRFSNTSETAWHLGPEE